MCVSVLSGTAVAVITVVILILRFCIETFVVLGEDGEWYSAEVYRLRELSGPLPPARKYVEGMFEGAQQIGLSPDYLEKIEGWVRESIGAVSNLG